MGKGGVRGREAVEVEVEGGGESGAHSCHYLHYGPYYLYYTFMTSHIKTTTCI